MALQFPIPATPSTPVAFPTPAILPGVTALYIWATGKDNLQYFKTGDTAAAVLSRSATTGTSFNATTGAIETSNAAPEPEFTLPNDLLSGWDSDGPFTILYFHDADCSAGGPAGSTDMIHSQKSSGPYTILKLEVSAGGGWVWQNYSDSPAWNITKAAYPVIPGRHVNVYRHESGAQHYRLDGTTLTANTVATSGGAALGAASTPLKTGRSFFVSSTRKSFFVGAIVVPSALTDQQITDLVGASGYIVTEGSGGSAPAAPSGVAASSITSGGATINWTDNSTDETGFKIQTSPSPYSTWTTAAGSPDTASPLAVTGLSPATTYKARVASTNGAGDSAWVESSPFTTLSKYLKVLMHPDAQSDTGVAGIVWQVQSGALAGAEVGEFSGKAFSGTLESGQAVLLVPVGDFGGAALAVGATVKCYLENSTDGSAMVTGTIVEA